MDICGVIDIEGYFFNNKFHPREVGWCNYSMTEHYSLHYFIREPYPKGDSKSCKTIGYQYNHCHGLSFKANYKCRKPERLRDDILAIYARQPKNRPVVAYKGGHIEKDLLDSLGLPSCDLEIYGCPKFEMLRDYSTVQQCGHHKDSSKHHCPVVETACFMTWLSSDCSCR